MFTLRKPFFFALLKLFVLEHLESEEESIQN